MLLMTKTWIQKPKMQWPYIVNKKKKTNQIRKPNQTKEKQNKSEFNSELKTESYSELDT